MRHLSLALQQSLADDSTHVGDGQVFVLCGRDGGGAAGQGGDARGGCLGDFAGCAARGRGGSTLEVFNVGLREATR